jgi:phosphoribosylamine--glycine ligase
MASKGYPEIYEKGVPISGLDTLKSLQNIQVFHSGTAVKDETIVTNGGRVLGVASLGKDLQEAQKNVYEAIKNVSFAGAHYRKDIGAKALNRKNR